MSVVEQRGHIYKVLATPYFVYNYCLLLTGSDSGFGVCQWFATIGASVAPRLRMLEPPGRGGGGLGFWQYDRRLEVAAGVAAFVSRQLGPPPPSPQRTIIKKTAFRRIYNKAARLHHIFFSVFLWFSLLVPL